MPFQWPEPDGEVDGQPAYICTHTSCGKMLSYKSFGTRCMNRRRLNIELPDWRKQSWCEPCRLHKWKALSPQQMHLFSPDEDMPENFPDPLDDGHEGA
jgi:hypothetical protein